MKFILDLFVLITGIGAASGLYYDEDRIFIVSDNSNYLYEYQIEDESLDKHLLLDMDTNEQVEKKQKLDIESITYYQDQYYMLPSGSKANRTKSFYFSPENMEEISLEDLDSSYTVLRRELDISQDDFNIEGVIFDQDTVLLFNRGNGPLKRNGIIRFPFGQNEKTIFVPLSLPEINHMASGFTDAVLVEDKIYFLAAAEGGGSSYDDGKIGGSQLGIINPNTWEVEHVALISDKHKFEGITLYKTDEDNLTFLLCDDPDDGVQRSAIHRLTIDRQSIGQF